VKDVGDKMHGRGSVGVIVGEGKAEFQDRVGIVASCPSDFSLQRRSDINSGRARLTLVNEEDSVPDRWVTDQRDDIHAKGTVGLVSQRGIFKGYRNTRKGVDSGRLGLGGPSRLGTRLTTR